jgi:Dyp-type peroxidase family
MTSLDSEDIVPIALKDLTPLDPMDISKLHLLQNLQGNILKGHGRDHTTHVFICFKEKHEAKARTWLREFTKAYVTCFQKQLKERELFKRNETIGGLFASVFLTKEGYKYLGFEDVNERFEDEGFQLGMKGRVNHSDVSKNVNNDPPVNEWEKGFREAIHAMILLADDDLTRLGETATKLLKGESDTKMSKNLKEISEIRSIEYGHVIRNANDDGIEHFGYVDGISQPLFLKDEVDNYMKFHNINLNNKSTGNKLNFDPRADADLVLIPDPYAPDASDKENTQSFGSYFVFRKLEQNVKGFKLKEKAIGIELFPDEDGATAQEKQEIDEKRELAGAYLVGRFEDGSPVVINDGDGLIGSGNFNNFNYNYKETDPSGGRCPHFAHIRKTNTRQQTDPANKSNSHVMARRGIPFGHRAIDTALGIDPSPHQMPEDGVGLLFMSYQKSIEKQFEFIQQNMANDPNSPAGIKTGIDPIIGQSANKDDKNNEDRNYAFPKEYNTPDAGVTSQGFEQFVHMKGGEYFFAPSMEFLNNIEDL